MRIAVLGPIEVDEGATSLSPRDKVTLGALYVADGDTLTAEQLADALWGDNPPKSAGKVIQGSVSRLRRVLGPSSISTTDSGYRLEVEPEAIDAAEFEALIGQARRSRDAHDVEAASATFRRALNLWRGVPLPELDCWDPAKAAAERLLEIRRTVEEEFVESELAAGRAGEAVAAARKLVARDPYREHRWALLALAYYRSGRQRDALEALRAAGDSLRENLGLDPGPELTDLEQRILQQDPTLLELPESQVPVSETCPYPGLRAYQADTSEFFFGREADIEAALERLDENPLLVVVGASGSGKSSLALAGIVPHLVADGLHVSVIAPGAAPVNSLATALASTPSPDVIVVDQLEELFASPTQDEVSTFLQRLTHFAVAPHKVIVTLRADFLASLSSQPTMARMAERGVLLLVPMDEFQLRRAIEEPARMSGLLLQPGLTDLVLRDTLDQAGGLPLMSHALAETWAHRDGRELTVAGYQETGGIQGSVAKSADRIYNSLTEPDQAALRSVFRRLVIATANGSLVAVRAPLDVFETSPDALRVVDLLARARLLSVSSDSVTVAHESLIRAWPRLKSWLDEDLAGQRLLQHLQAAAQSWTEAGEPDDELYRGVRLQATIEWQQRSRPVLSLNEQTFLAKSADLAAQAEQARVEQLNTQRKRNQQLRFALVGVVSLLVLALVAGTIAGVNGRRAQASTLTAEAARMASVALAEQSSDLALALAQQAYAISPTAGNQSALARVLATQRGLLSSGVVSGEMSTRAPEDIVNDDGSRMLVAQFSNGPGGNPGENSRPSFSYLIDTATGAKIGHVLGRGHGSIKTFDSAPAGFIDHGRIAVISRSNWTPDGWPIELVRFRASDGRQIGKPEPLPESFAGNRRDNDRPRISPDGRVLVSAIDRHIRIWHKTAAGWGLPTMVSLPTLAWSDYFNDRVAQISVGADDRYAAVRLIYANGDPSAKWAGLVVLIDLKHARLVGVHAGQLPLFDATESDPLGPSAMALSYRGDRLVLGYASGTIVVVYPGLLGERVIYTRRTISALSLLDSPGDIALVGDSFGALSEVDLTTGRIITSLPGSSAAIASVATITAGHSIDPLAVALDETGRITRLSLLGSNRFMEVLPGLEATNVSASVNGRVVAAAFRDGTVALVDPQTLQTTKILRPPPRVNPSALRAAFTTTVTALGVTPDGSMVIAATRGGDMWEWSAATGVLLRHNKGVYASFLAISPDGRWCATFESTLTAGYPLGRPFASFRPSYMRIWDLRQDRSARTVDFPSDLGQSNNLPSDDVISSTEQLATLALALPSSASFSSDSSDVAVAMAVTLVGVDVYGTQDHSHRRLSNAPAVALSFPATSRSIAVADGQGRVALLDARTGKVLRQITALSGLAALASTSDGQALVGVSPRGLAMWNARTGQAEISGLDLPYLGDQLAPELAVVGHDVAYVVTGGQLVRVDLNPTHWEQLACGLAGRGLTRTEWRQYLPDQPYRPSCVAS